VLSIINHKVIIYIFYLQILIFTLFSLFSKLCENTTTKSSSLPFWRTQKEAPSLEYLGGSILAEFFTSSLLIATYAKISVEYFRGNFCNTQEINEILNILPEYFFLITL